MTQTISFTVYGKAEPAGSKQAFVPLDRKTGQPFRRANGGVVVNTVDDNKNSRTWKRQVSIAAKAAYDGPPLTGPLRFKAFFHLPRIKAHFRTGRYAHLLRDDAPTEHVVKPDVLKLARAVEDACTGICYVDDSQIVHEVLEKTYISVGNQPYVAVVVEELVF